MHLSIAGGCRQEVCPGSSHYSTPVALLCGTTACLPWNSSPWIPPGFRQLCVWCHVRRTSLAKGWRDSGFLGRDALSEMAASARAASRGEGGCTDTLRGVRTARRRHAKRVVAGQGGCRRESGSVEARRQRRRGDRSVTDSDARELSAGDYRTCLSSRPLSCEAGATGRGPGWPMDAARRDATGCIWRWVGDGWWCRLTRGAGVEPGFSVVGRAIFPGGGVDSRDREAG